MSQVIKAYRLKKSTMGGSEWLHVVYTEPGTADLVAENRAEEWVDFKVHEVSVRMLNETEGAIGTDLVQINRTTPKDIYRARALRKLTKEEKEALNL